MAQAGLHSVESVRNSLPENTSVPPFSFLSSSACTLSVNSTDVIVERVSFQDAKLVADTRSTSQETEPSYKLELVPSENEKILYNKCLPLIDHLVTLPMPYKMSMSYVDVVKIGPSLSNSSQKGYVVTTQKAKFGVTCVKCYNDNT